MVSAIKTSATNTGHLISHILGIIENTILTIKKNEIIILKNLIIEKRTSERTGEQTKEQSNTRTYHHVWSIQMSGM